MSLHLPCPHLFPFHYVLKSHRILAIIISVLFVLFMVFVFSIMSTSYQTVAVKVFPIGIMNVFALIVVIMFASPAYGICSPSEIMWRRLENLTCVSYI